MKSEPFGPGHMVVEHNRWTSEMRILSAVAADRATAMYEDLDAALQEARRLAAASPDGISYAVLACTEVAMFGKREVVPRPASGKH